MSLIFESFATISPASHLLAGVFALGFLAILWIHAWRGYWRGPIRCLAPLAAFFIAGTLAWLFGAELGFALLGQCGIPWIFRGLFGVLLTGILVWLPIFALLWFWGRKQVSEQTGEPEYPITGTVIGCWTGGFWVAFLLLVITAAGTLGETLQNKSNSGSSSLRTRVCDGAVLARNSAALIPGFYFVRSWNPLPEAFVRKLDKLIAVLSERSLARKFIYANAVQSVLTLPSVYPVVNSPKIQRMLEARDVDGILADPDINRMLDDEDFQRALTEIDFEQLLDEVLAGKAEPNAR